MKTRFVLLLIASLSISCESSYRKEELYGSYELSSLKILLQPDGTFHYESSLTNCFGHEYIDFVDGDFFVAGQYILLRSTKCHEQFLQVVPEYKLIWDSLRPMSHVFNFYDSLLILPVNKKIFLLGANPSRMKESRYKEFTSLTYDWGGARHFLNGINANDTTGFHWRYLHKTCESCTETDLKKSLPNEWIAYLTGGEIKARVTQIDTIEITALKVPYVTIDAGEEQGVRRQYEFFSDSTECFTILEVHQNYSKGAAYAYGRPKSLFIGQTLSTVKPKQKSQRSLAGSLSIEN